MEKFKSAVQLLNHLGFFDGTPNPIYNKNDWKNNYKKFNLCNPEHFTNWHDQGLNSEYFEIEFVEEDVVRNFQNLDGTHEYTIYNIYLADRSVYTVAFYAPYDSWSSADYFYDPIFVKPVTKTVTIWEKTQ